MDNNRESRRAFMTQVLDEAVPMSMQWDLTWRCDHKCVHCYLTDRRQPELTLAEATDLLDQLAAAGTMSLLISGGDPFLRPDALDILRAARARQFDVRINTHGNFIDEALAGALAEIGISRVAISVYSDDPAEHEAVTRIPGSHALSLRAGRLLRDRGVAVAFKTPVMTHNRLRWIGVGALAEAIGATWQTDSHIVPDDESDFGLCAVGVPSTDRMLAMLHEIAPHREQVNGLQDLPREPSTGRTCSAGSASGYVSPDGRIWPCLNWREEMGSIRDRDFKAIWWENSVAERMRRIRRSSYLKDCDGCHLHGNCDYCPGISHAETGDAARRSAYVCERTHLGAAAYEYMGRLNAAEAPVPLPGSPEAEALFSGTPTFAERQWAARKAGMARQADGLAPGLVQIIDPKKATGT